MDLRLRKVLLFGLSKFALTRFIIDIILQSKTKLVVRKLRKKTTILLEIGSGDNKGVNGWTTLDSSWGADLQWDLRNGIPFPDNSLDKIYASHVFEHIPFAGLQAMIRECWRVLKPEGSLSVCVPNARLYIDAYISGAYFRDQASFWKSGICNTGSYIDQINYIAYMGGTHKFMFDSENLIKILQNNGFKQARLRDFDCSIDLIDRDFESIYAEAVK